MNIIDLLIEDHAELRKEVVAIKRTLSQDELRDKIKLFISKYEIHESVEEEILFPALSSLPPATVSERFIPDYEKTHERIWTVLDQLVALLGHGRYDDLQQAFFQFNAVFEAHLRQEERILFPTIRNILDRTMLEALGQKAEKRFARFENF